MLSSDSLENVDDLESKLLIEAAIFMAGNSIKISDLHRQVPHLSKNKLISLLHSLKDDYDQYEGALKIEYRTKNTVAFNVKDSLIREPEIEEFTAGKEFNTRELKTLAFIAYYQPTEDQDIHDLVGRGSKKAIKTLEKRGFISAETNSYPVLNEEGEEIINKVKIYRTTPKFAAYLEIENNPNEIKEWIEKFL